jgi:hypothetical protein
VWNLDVRTLGPNAFFSSQVVASRLTQAPFLLTTLRLLMLCICEPSLRNNSYSIVTENQTFRYVPAARSRILTGNYLYYTATIHHGFQ